MSATEPQPYWNWAVRGLGGVLNMMESLLADECRPSEHQRTLLEYQAARLERIWRTSTVPLVPGEIRPLRSVDAINSVRDFGREEVLD